MRRCSITWAFFSRASVSKYALVTSSVPSVWFFNSPRLRILCRKRSRFSGSTFTTIWPFSFPFACFSESVVATYPCSSLANAVIFWIALSKPTISSSTVALRISLRLANAGAVSWTEACAASSVTVGIFDPVTIVRSTSAPARSPSFDSAGAGGGGSFSGKFRFAKAPDSAARDAGTCDGCAANCSPT